MKQWRRWVLVALVVVGGVGLTRETSANEKWGPFRGQVVDVETGQPIPGAVALAVWWKLVPNLVAGNREFYDAREAVTGADGTFEIPRLSVQLWPLGVQPAGISLFAPGYRWEATVVTPSDSQRFVAPTTVKDAATEDGPGKALGHFAPLSCPRGCPPRKDAESPESPQ